MNVKTMEGLAGADASMRLISTPMNVAKEAERKGDTDKMQRALGYAAGMAEQAEGYEEKASEGMALDAKEAKEQEKLKQEEIICKRREENKEQEKRIEEGKAQQETGGFDSVEISEEGKIQAEQTGEVSAGHGDTAGDAVYNKSGETVEPAQEAGANVNVSV